MRFFAYIIASSFLTTAFAGQPVKGDSTELAAIAAPGDNVDAKLKPSIALGFGTFTFSGDIQDNNKGFHLGSARYATLFRASYPLNSYLDIQFHTAWGKLSSNERSITNLSRNLNFESRIRSGGLTIGYDFEHLYKSSKTPAWSPFLYVGIESFEFLSKTDLYDANGNLYHYWSDGSIRNLSQTDPNAASAIKLTRDYIYETDLRELNQDGYGKYQERSWAFPVGLAFRWDMNEFFKFRAGFEYHFTTTDLLDAVTAESGDGRAGNAGNDKFIFTNFSLSYNLQPLRDKKNKEDDKVNPWEEPLFALDTTDTDNDGVVDFQDVCALTPENCQPVGPDGCPADLDNDLVPDCIDRELDSPGPYTDKYGVTITDEMIELAFKRFKDSTGEFSEYETTDKSSLVITGNPSLNVKTTDKNISSEHVVIIGDEKLNISPNELYKYLGFKEFETIVSGDSTYYVLGGMSLADAAKLEKDLNEKGIETDGVAHRERSNTGKIILVKNSEFEKELAIEESDNKVPELTSSEDIVFRVQIGSYRREQAYEDFIGIPEIVQFQGSDGQFRYFSGSFDNLAAASKHKVIMTAEAGFPGAFVVAFKDGKRISLREITEVNPEYNENISEYEAEMSGDTIPKIEDAVYRIQLGAFKDGIPREVLDFYLTLGNVKPVKDPKTGVTKYLVGEYSTQEEARKAEEEFKGMGANEAYIIIDYKGKIIDLVDKDKFFKTN
jgi:hypothetical protein